MLIPDEAGAPPPSLRLYLSDHVIGNQNFLGPLKFRGVEADILSMLLMSYCISLARLDKL